MAVDGTYDDSRVLFEDASIPSKESTVSYNVILVIAGRSMVGYPLKTYSTATHDNRRRYYSTPELGYRSSQL